MTQTPDRMIYLMEDTYDTTYMEMLANAMLEAVKDRIPKITGSLARSVEPVFGPNFWGIYFPDKRMWYLERGTSPFLMRSLAGKTIPMWVDDSDGSIAKKAGRKAKTRISVDGRAQTLIFRRVAKPGERKEVRRNGRLINVPRSYPGAPGRIRNRVSSGRIAAGNVGVRWRHPGIRAREYMNQAMEDTAEIFGIDNGQVFLIDAATYPTATKR
jgi:hypothetical protein